jgi:PadR family transcriptional regulator, regulatory protein AphA
MRGKMAARGRLVKSGLVCSRALMPRLTTTSYAILGLLSFARMSGYDLAAVSDRSIAHFWPVSKTQVYAELRRLSEAGLAAGTQAETSGGPAKTVYELTAAGEQALDAWLEQPADDRTRLRAPALLKVLLGHRGAPRQSRAQLERFRSGAEERRDHLQRLVARLAENPDAFYAWATALFSLRLAETMARWADEVLAAVPERPIRLDPRRRDPATATALLGEIARRR